MKYHHFWGMSPADFLTGWDASPRFRRPGGGTRPPRFGSLYAEWDCITDTVPLSSEFILIQCISYADTLYQNKFTGIRCSNH